MMAIILCVWKLTAWLPKNLTLVIMRGFVWGLTVRLLFLRMLAESGSGFMCPRIIFSVGYIVVIPAVTVIAVKTTVAVAVITVKTAVAVAVIVVILAVIIAIVIRMFLIFLPFFIFIRKMFKVCIVAVQPVVISDNDPQSRLLPLF